MYSDKADDINLSDFVICKNKDAVGDRKEYKSKKGYN